jgi:hypothetical protein
MEGYYQVERNILDYLFVSYDCFNVNCPGKIVISLNNLYMSTRTQCPICKREDSLHPDTHYFEQMRKYFEYVYRQLHELELLPLAFSPAISPKTVFLDSKQ